MSMWNPSPPQGFSSEQGQIIIGRPPIPRFGAPQGIGGVIPPVVDTIVKSVQKIEFTIAVNESSNTAMLTKGQIDTKCVPFTTIRTTANSEERFDTRLLTVTISGTTVTATRDFASTTTTVEVIIYVVEYTDDITVQTGEATVLAGQLSVTDSPTTDFTDLSKTFVYLTYMPNSPQDDLNDSYTTVEITDTQTLTFTRQATTGAITCQWYTVECNGTQFDVQRGSFVLNDASTDSNTQLSAPFTAVDMARTMTIGNYNNNENSDDGETGNCTIDLVDSTHVRARRANGTTPNPGHNIQIDFQVIQFETSQNISAQRGEFIISGTSDTDTITEVNTEGSMAHSPGGQNNASINSAAGADMGSFFASMDIQDSTTVRGRTITNIAQNTVNSWEVVEWLPLTEPMGLETLDLMAYETGNLMGYEV